MRSTFRYYNSLFDSIPMYKYNEVVKWPSRRKNVTFEDLFYADYPKWIFLYHELESFAYWTVEKLIDNAVTENGRRLVFLRRNGLAYSDERYNDVYRI